MSSLAHCVEPSIYERVNMKDLLIKQRACPFKGHAHSRVIVVAHHAICQSSIVTTYRTVTITYYDIVSSRPSDQSRNHRKTNFGEMSSMRCFDHTSRSYDHTEI